MSETTRTYVRRDDGIYRAAVGPTGDGRWYAIRSDAPAYDAEGREVQTGIVERVFDERWRAWDWVTGVSDEAADSGGE